MYRLGLAPVWLASIMLPFALGSGLLADSASSSPSESSISGTESAVNVPALLARADSGDPVAQNAVGLCYLQGVGVARDYAVAAKWFRKAASEDNADGQANLGLLLMK